VPLRCCSRCISSVGIEQEADDEFVEPDDRTLALTIFFEKDDSQLGKPTEFLVDVLYVSVNNPGSLAMTFIPVGT
jgi:hypothetical protein